MNKKRFQLAFVHTAPLVVAAAMVLPCAHSWAAPPVNQGLADQLKQAGSCIAKEREQLQRDGVKDQVPNADTAYSRVQAVMKMLNLRIEISSQMCKLSGQQKPSVAAKLALNEANTRIQKDTSLQPQSAAHAGIALLEAVNLLNQIPDHAPAPLPQEIGKTPLVAKTMPQPQFQRFGNDLTRAESCLGKLRGLLPDPRDKERAQSVLEAIQDARKKLPIPDGKSDPDCRDSVPAALQGARDAVHDAVADLEDLHSREMASPLDALQLEMATTRELVKTELNASAADLNNVSDSAPSGVQSSALALLALLATLTALVLLGVMLYERKGQPSESTKTAPSIDDQINPVIKKIEAALTSAQTALLRATAARERMASQLAEQQAAYAEAALTASRTSESPQTYSSDYNSREDESSRFSNEPAAGIPGVNLGGEDYGTVLPHSARYQPRPLDDPAPAYSSGSDQARFTSSRPRNGAVDDYNRCLDMDQSQALNWFFSTYHEIRRLSCTNLEEARSKSARPTLKLDPSGNFVAIAGHDGDFILLPMIGPEPRAFRKSLEGVFTYPAHGSTARYRLMSPALARAEIGETFVVRERGEFISG